MTEQSWEQGSNLSKGVGFIGLDALRDRLKQFSIEMRGRVLREALYAAAEVYKRALEGAAPVGGVYSYRRGDREQRLSDPHPGQLRRSVIIYERQSRTKLSVAAEDLALLVGFERRSAYYAYWQEYGWKAKNGRHIAGKGFGRSAADGAEEAAFNAAIDVLSREVAA